MRPKMVVLLCLGTLVACSEEAPQPEESLTYASPIVPAPVETKAAEPVSLVPPPRSHNYDEERERTYSYIAAISDEERKQGKAAGSVSNFRYLGRNADGEHILAAVTGTGVVRYYGRCPDRCVIIRYDDGDQTAYNPGSIIGGAFQDAIRGHLKKWTPPAPPPQVQYFDEEEPTSSEPIPAEPTSEPLPEMPAAQESVPAGSVEN